MQGSEATWSGANNCGGAPRIILNQGQLTKALSLIESSGFFEIADSYVLILIHRLNYLKEEFMESCSIIFDCFEKFFECILHVYYLIVYHLYMLKLQVLKENRANSITLLHLVPKDLVVVLD